MQAVTRRKFKWFWAWQDEREEEWLRSMAQQGWHLVSLFPTIYTFEQGEPRDDVYRLDFITSNTDTEEYLQLFADAGWEHFGVMSGWQYFRKPAAARQSDEIYTDPKSKAQKYRRLIGFLVIFSPVWVVAVLPAYLTRVRGTLWALGPAVFSAAFSVVWAYGLIMIARRIRQLEAAP